jgi:hypothetical protein
VVGKNGIVPARTLDDEWKLASANGNSVYTFGLHVLGYAVDSVVLHHECGVALTSRVCAAAVFWNSRRTCSTFWHLGKSS